MISSGQENHEEQTKLAVLSDIHGNYPALRQCVEYALVRGITTFVFLGDYTGELPYSRKTMDYLYKLKQRYTCCFIRGNREDYMLNYRETGEIGWTKGNSASGALLYTYEELTAQDLTFFESLSIKQVLTFPKLPPLTICHGSPHRVNERLDPGKEATYETMRNDSSSYILCGHTHVQGEIRHGEKVIWNPGSVGVPVESGGKTQFMILRGTDDSWQQEFLSLAYDVEAVISQMEVSGLNAYAPYWCQVTEYMLRGVRIDHGDVLVRAMELCTQQYGKCKWPEIPEECWAQAVREGLPEEDLGEKYLK